VIVKEDLSMRLTLFPPPAAAALGAVIVLKGGRSARVRAVVLAFLASVVLALGHDRDGPDDAGRAARVWPGVL
jgi:hypothetical protein